MTDQPHQLVLFDGECGLCDRAVQFILRHDHRRTLQFAPLQGPTASRFVTVQAGVPFDTMVYVERAPDGIMRRYERSAAVFAILRRMGAGWPVLALLRVLPRRLTDVLYNFVSRRRIRWFGRVGACRLPDAATASRFFP